MWWNYLEQGGPLMLAVLAAWVIVLAGVVDRGLYALGRGARRPASRMRALCASGAVAEARRLARTEHERARRGVTRIDGVSQLATSLGLFGTVVGIAQGFLARGGAGAATESLDGLASGLSTALFTTIGGLAVFLFGQIALLVYSEWLEVCERGSVATGEEVR